MMRLTQDVTIEIVTKESMIMDQDDVWYMTYQ